MKKLKSKELNPDKINANVQKDGKSRRPPKQRERYIHVPIKENDKLGKACNIQFEVRTTDRWSTDRGPRYLDLDK